LCGTTNTRVTANNAEWAATRRIQPGARILVGKAGEIIPKIIKVISFATSTDDEKTSENRSENRSQGHRYGPVLDVSGENRTTVHTTGKTAHNANTPLLITHCPTCDEPLQWEGVHLVCNGKDCLAKKIISVAHFYSSRGIKIDGIGDATIEKLLYNEACYNVLVKKPWALLDCKAYGITDDVFAVLGDKTALNIMLQIEQASGTKHMAHFITGLGLPGIGYKTALRLCRFLKTGKLKINVSQQARMAFAKSVVTFYHASKEMTNFTFCKIPKIARAIYCITGTLSKSRDEMIELLDYQGFEFSSNVTKEVNYLIVGESPGKLKIDRAKKYDIPQISEAQLLNLLREIDV